MYFLDLVEVLLVIFKKMFLKNNLYISIYILSYMRIFIMYLCFVG